MKRARAAARRRLAVVAPQWLGDAVMSLAAVDRAAAAGWEVVVVASPYTARVYWGVAGVVEIQADPGPGRLARVRARARALRAYRADAAVVLPPSFSSALPAWLARVPVRAGFASDARRALLTAPVPTPARTTHLSASYVDLVRRALGEQAPARPRTLAPAARVQVADAERAAIERTLARHRVKRGGYVLVVPGAAYGPAKAWPRERYRRACEELARDVRVVLGGSAGDRAGCDEIAGGLDGVANLAGATTLGEFFALVEGARAVLANDSGAPHVAASLGVPTVVLFGSTLPEWTAPVGGRVEVMQHKVHCNPCFRRTCPTQLECFHGIEPGEVTARVRRALSS
jgi:heptosyltransferase-2